MPRWLFVALVVLSVDPNALVAQTPEQEVMRAEQARIEARRKGDTATLTRLASDQLLLVTPSGEVQDAKYSAALAAAPKLEMRDVKTQVFGDVAVVTGTQSGTGSNASDLRFTRVWQKRSGQWLNVFVQNTRITPPQAAPASPSSTVKQVAPTTWPTGASQDERDVLKVQRSLNEAFAKKDAAAYGQMTADTFVRILPDGGLSQRAEFLKAVAATPDVKRVESNNSDFRLRTYGPVALLTYVDRTPAAPAGTRMTRVYVKQNGAWKQLVTQSTPMVP